MYMHTINTYLFILRVYFKHLFTFVLCSNFEIFFKYTIFSFSDIDGLTSGSVPSERFIFRY